MKKFLTYLIIGCMLVAITVISGCSKKPADNQTPTKTPKEFLTENGGSWHMVKLEYKDKTTGNWVTEPIDDGHYLGVLYFTNLTFTADGKGTLSGVDGPGTTTWIADSSNLEVNDPNGIDLHTTFEMANTTFSITWNIPGEADYDNDAGHGFAVKAIAARQTFSH